jgi:hypothetical protein
VTLLPQCVTTCRSASTASKLRRTPGLCVGNICALLVKM